jgi:hypothetical protein
VQGRTSKACSLSSGFVRIGASFYCLCCFRPLFLRFLKCDMSNEIIQSIMFGEERFESGEKLIRDYLIMTRS